MSRLVFALLTLPLLAAPCTGAAEILPGPRNLQAFGTLFHSRPPALTAPSAVPRALPTLPAPALSAGTICRPALAAAETRHGIPAGLLQAIGMVESGRRDEATGRREPWPWTINAEGEPHYFDTKQQAVNWVRQAQARGVRSIDVGCAQVNLVHHPNAFAGLEQAFDPAANADYAARFLRSLREEVPGGNWLTAAGYYHSRTPALAAGYRQRVQAALAVAGGPSLAVATAPVSMAAPAIAAARPEPGALLPAPAGTAGRGLDAYRASPIQIVARPAAARLRSGG